jgi:hypothetical protein
METKNNQLTLIMSESGLEKSKSNYLLEKFQAFFEMADEWEKKVEQIKVTSREQVAEMKMAREGRLFLKAKRIEVEKARKELKEQSLREGKAIDGVANILKSLIVPLEEKLENYEKFAELEDARIKEENRMRRHEMLIPFGIDVSSFDLGGMSEETFFNLYDMSKKNHEEKIENEKRAEAERIEREKREVEERERQRVENERLRAEAVERERKIAEEREKAEAERRAIEERARIEREELKRIAAEERAKQEAILNAERKERERIEAEIRAKAEAEERVRKEKEAEERRVKRAPDKEKLIALSLHLQAMNLPEVSSDEAKNILSGVKNLLEKISSYINLKINLL